MYEKLEKLRADLNKAKKRKEEADVRVKIAEEKLREAENMQILSEVNALKLKPEQVAEFLKLATAGKFPEIDCKFEEQKESIQTESGEVIYEKKQYQEESN